MDYLLKASAILFLFYICYQLFLRRDTFFQSNRWFLLVGLVIASCIPLVVIPVYIEYTAINTSNFIYTLESTSNFVEKTSLNYEQLVFWSYLIGVLVFFLKLSIDFLSLRKILNNSKTISSESFKIMETSENVSPFSFFNYIVYNPNQFKKEELEYVINHEKVHVIQLHSVDIVIAQIACILLWFNPIVWLYKKALQQNLEFIADQKAQYISPCKKSYQTILLKTSIKNHQFVFTNNFYTSLIKKRIVMLHKSKSNNLNQLKIAFILPLLALFMMSFNIEDVYIEIPSEEKIISNSFQTEDIEQVFHKDMTNGDLDKIKTELKNKGVEFNYNSIKRNTAGEITGIKTEFEYNGNSSTYNIKSNDVIKPFIFQSYEGSFIVGTFTDEHPKIYTKTSTDAKAQSKANSHIDIIEEIVEDKYDEESKTEASSQESKTLIIEQAKDKNISLNNKPKTNVEILKKLYKNSSRSKSDIPLFVVNGKIVKKSIFEDINSNDIESVFVLKGNNAIDNFGDRAKDGAIVVHTKGSKNKLESYFTSNDTEITYELNHNDKEQPLFIVDGEKISQGELRSLNSNSIKSLNVIKGDDALSMYGKQGENGVIIIKTKSPNQFSGDNLSTFIEIENSEPWDIQTKAKTIIYENNSGTPTIEFIISKNSTNKFLDRQTKALKKIGIDAKFSKVKRNKKGEITNIKIALDDNGGSISSATWKDKTNAIPDIVVGKSYDDNLYIREISD